MCPGIKVGKPVASLEEGEKRIQIARSMTYRHALDRSMEIEAYTSRVGVPGGLGYDVHLRSRSGSTATWHQLSMSTPLYSVSFKLLPLLKYLFMLPSC